MMGAEEKIVNLAMIGCGGYAAYLIDRLVEMPEVCKLLAALNPRPDGLFVDSDRSLATLYPVLVREKLVVPDETVMIGCNNQQCYLEGIVPHPATMDVHFEQVGRIGVSPTLVSLY